MLTGGSILMLMYCAATLALPPLFRCAAAFLAIGFTLTQWRLGAGWHLPHLALLVLSAPMQASLDFLGGYPLRWLSAQGSAALLSLSGLSVSAEGTLLRWGTQLVEIDAPCSGTRMLYTALFLMAAVAAIRRLDGRGALICMVLVLPIMFVANIVRSSALFFMEAGLIQAPAWVHSGSGLLVFGLLVISLTRTGSWPVPVRLQASKQ
jgi:exosortase/archaeosortase family protein